ncbi:glycosyltransferase family 1 protein [uncultured Bacteroides sp.]|uniref:glycosyltransferase family 4 protein n=1 Tax=uncultured Bacteroides sp. TaxID=162156 RepID=UPI0025D8E937|nr:glycosyltransferase family 1 protein [uncultured Bacteroides sp.]
MITYFIRNQKAGYSLHKQSIQLINEVSQGSDVEIFELPEYRAYPWHMLKNIFFVYKHRNRKGINHLTGDVHYCILALIGCISVLTVHDLSILDLPTKKIKRLINYFFWVFLPFRICTRIVCISNYTKRQVQKFTSRKDIEVIYDSLSPTWYYSPRRFCEKSPVILCVGTAKHKNLERVIEAVVGLNCRLRIVGNMDSNLTKLLKINHLSYSNVKNLSDDEIYDEYRECDIVCFPSCYEGFGMPIIEGNAIGRCVLTSDMDPMKEVAGNAACLVNPYSKESIRIGISKIMHDADYRQFLVKQGLLNITKYSSFNIANQYVELYKKLNNDCNRGISHK